MLRNFLILLIIIAANESILAQARGGTLQEDADSKPDSETTQKDLKSSEVDFNRDIRPLLATHCLNCHGPDEESRESGLRLDQYAAATSEADSGELPIVPGKPEQSEILRRMLLDPDDGERMPPAGRGLSPEEIQKVRQWIKSGAEYEMHWAFVKPKAVTLPPVRKQEWVRNGIDRFVLAKLESASLQPSTEANRFTLIRRVYLDLTGLPPTPEEADRFVKDPSTDAYERMVDRALASPRLGERWARVWLDLARYADSQGYAQDSPRMIFRYRDWVVDAINRNLPFDQFTIEQIAGDMLKNPSNEQILATAFHRNTMTNSEGGTDNEEFRTAAVVDRVNSTLQIWMGMTMGCAQCHTHKYDPITQEEYFRVFALLNQTEDADRNNEAPLFSEFSEQRRLQQARLHKRIAELEKQVQGQAKNDVDFTLPQGSLKARYIRVQGLGKMFLHLAEVEVFDRKTNLARKGKASQSSTAFSGPAKLANDGSTNGDFEKGSVTHTAEENNPWWEVDLGSVHNLSKVVVWNRTDSDGVRDRLQKYRIILLDQNRSPVWTSKELEPPRPSKSFTVPATFEKLSPTEIDQLKQLAREMGKGESVEQKQLAKLKTQLKNVTKPDITTPIMRQLPRDKQRKTFIQVRGNFRNPGELVQPGTPKIFHELRSQGDSPDRLDLARWLVSNENPITARVTVNRFWEHLFGTGIVETSEDFGTQGDLPSHPDLLDFLAIRFIESGWDVKWLLKTIVTSATYRQTSRVSPGLMQMDPRNRLLARGPRMRLPAEMIRDQALFIAGTLSSKMNGPSVRPPKPKLGLRAAFGGTTDWDPSPGEDAYRRGLYTLWRRTSPYPSMTTFDAPSREFCTIRRSRTNTPLQALVTLNDPVFVDAARRLAIVTLQSHEQETDRIKFLFRRVLVRPCEEKELEFMQASLQKIRKGLTEEAARQLVDGGNDTKRWDTVELASWIVLGNVILNLDETLARP